MIASPPYTGRVRYLSRYLSDSYSLLVALRCIIGQRVEEDVALVDTAAEWCILPAAVADDLGYTLAGASEAVPLSTRFGVLTGSLERIPLRFPADDGASMSIEATWFVSADWPGPTVIGWTGGLERMRFAIDPGEEALYFGEL